MVKRKHHFVPKFYLEAFRSEVRRIHLYNLKRLLPVQSASLRDQCYKHRFYGPDDEVENLLAGLEGSLAPVLKEIRSKGVLPPAESDKHLHLLTFGAMQVLRTPKHAERLNRMFDKALKQVYSGAANQLGMDLEATRIGFDDTVLITLRNLPQMQAAVSDLRAHLIVSSRNAFLTSDNPAFKYNQYCEEIQYTGVTGAIQKGLQIFIPLSPRLQLVLYDGSTYRAVAGRYSRSSGAKQSDIDQLNKMQLISADENVYFADWQQLHDITRLLPEIENLRIPDSTVVQEYGQDDDPNSSLIHQYDQTGNMSLDLSFLSLKGEVRRVPIDDRPHQYRNQPPTTMPTGNDKGVKTFSRFIGRR